MLAQPEIIRSIAHGLWETEGQPEGKALEHWLEAQRRLLTIDVEAPWYDAGTMVDEIDWMRRALWQPQPWLAD